MIARTRTATAVLLAALGAAALADVNVEVGNGDKVTGTLSPASEREVFRVRVPKGAAISVKSKSATKGLVLNLALADPADASLGTTQGTAPSFKGIVAGTSGLFSVTVTSQGGATPGNYSLSISWKTPTKFAASADLGAASTQTLEFAVDSGAAATLSVKPGKGSAATAALNQITAPGALVTPLSGTTVQLTLTSGGTHVLAFGNLGPAQGVVDASVKVKPAKVVKRKIALTSNVIGAGGALGDAAFASVLGPGGGSVTVPFIAPGSPGAEISGSAVNVPAGSLGVGTAIIVATSPNINKPGQTTDAGPSVFFGPEGARFDAVDKNARATVTIPYDPAYDADTSLLVVYTRDAKGKVTAVPRPYTFNAAAHTMSFQTSHFSSFQAAGTGVVAGGDMFTYANVTTPRDVCLAFDSSTSSQYLFYVAEGTDKTVAGLAVATVPGAVLQRDLWAGGGGSSVGDGTESRLQFNFVDPVESVFALDDGTVYIATTRQIFKVGDDSKVLRIAGTGGTGNGGDGSVASAATFTSIRAIRVTLDGSVFVADAGAHRIRFIDAQQGNTIRAFAGTGQVAFGVDGGPVATTTFLGPADIEFSQDGGLYVADGGRVRKLKPGPAGQEINITVAGSATGATGSTGDDGPLLGAKFESISGIETFIDFRDPFPALPYLVVSDSADHTIRYIDQTNDRVILVAGQHGIAGNGPDIGPKTGLLSSPSAVIGFPGQIVIADEGNDKIRARLGFGGP